MELYFNELSIKHIHSLDYAVAAKISEVYNTLKEYDVSTCRIDIKDNEKLFAMISELPHSINIKNFYYSFFKLPFENEEVVNKEDKYYEHNWQYKDTDCFGLAITYLMDSISYSIYQDEWNEYIVTICKDGQEEKIRNISTKEHIVLHFSNLEDEINIDLLECEIHYSQKRIHLRDDHGIDKLKEFSKKLVHSPYVVEVVNSLPYNSHRKKFIKDIKEDGLVEIVLPWTDQGLGIVVRTTGRSKKETNKIAKLLEEKYGYI